jgi:hypothetical protein
MSGIGRADASGTRGNHTFGNRGNDSGDPADAVPSVPPLPEEYFAHKDDSIINNNATASMANSSLYSTGTSNSFTIQSETELTPMGYFMICGFLFVLALCLFLLIWNVWRQRRQRFLESVSGSSSASYAAASRALKQRIQRRYETVEHWIISKKVLPHNDFCAAVVANFDHHNNTAPSSTDAPLSNRNSALEESTDVAVSSSEDVDAVALVKQVPPAELEEPTNVDCIGNELESHHDDCIDPENEMQECPICMLELLPGEIASWSSNEQCCHGMYQTILTLPRNDCSLVSLSHSVIRRFNSCSLSSRMYQRVAPEKHAVLHVQSNLLAGG